MVKYLITQLIKKSSIYHLTLFLVLASFIAKSQCQYPLPGQQPLGANLAGLADYDRNRPFNNVFKTNRGFSGNINAPWTFTSIPLMDVNGWPLQDFSVIVMAAMDSTMGGTYKLRFNGQATVTPLASGFTVQNKIYNSASNVTTADLVFPAVITSGQMMMSFTNTNYTTSVGGVKNIQIMKPGTTFTTQTFDQKFLNHLQRFSTLRFMDWHCTNANTDSLWANRKLPTHTTQTGKSGCAWEYCIELANTLQKDMWINIPHKADSNYIFQLATLIKNNLNPNLNVYVEYSNEVWNWGFTQANWNKQQAIIEGNANGPVNFDGINDVNTWHYRRIAKQGKKISDIFKNVYGTTLFNARIKPVYAVQGAWFDVGQRGLEFIKNYYGAPKNYFYALAGAPYFSAAAVDTANVATPQQVVAALQNSNNNIFYGFGNSLAQYAAMSKYYDLKFLCYEGGPDTFGPNNITSKKVASRSNQMKLLCAQHLSEWYKYGPNLYMWFTAGAGDWTSQYGTWSLTEFFENSAKLKGIDSVLASPVVMPTRGVVMPANVDARKYEGYPSNWNTTTLFSPSWQPYFQYLINVPSGQAGNYKIQVETKCNQNGASFGVYIDDVFLQNISVNNNANVSFDTALVGNILLSEGLHTIRYKKISGNYNIRNYLLIKTAGCLTTDITENKLNSDLLVFPNPANNQIKIRFSEDLQNADLKIIDISGRSVMTFDNINLNEEYFLINIQSLNNGVYFVQLKNNNNSRVYSSKIIKN